MFHAPVLKLLYIAIGVGMFATPTMIHAQQAAGAPWMSDGVIIAGLTFAGTIIAAAFRELRAHINGISAEMRREIEQLKTKNDRLEEKNDLLVRENADLSGKVTALTAMLQAITGERDKLIERVSELERTVPRARRRQDEVHRSASEAV